MKLKFSFIGIFGVLMLNNHLHAQEGDYMKMRAGLVVLGCGDFDTATLLNAHRKLVKLDTNTLTKNRNEYFKDLGWSYYKLAPKFNDSLMMEGSIYNFRRAWQLKPEDWLTLGNLCNTLALNKHCGELEMLIPRLTDIVPRKNRKDVNTGDMLKACAYKKWWFKNY